jgi:crotonobetainyl-CoA:carnitine CoA-transferase CaiB-like acyl-CoA transferase
LAAHDVPHAPVLGVSAALAHPHAAARRMVEEVEHPTAGVLSLLGRPIKFPGTEQPPLRPPPRLGEHGEALLRELLGLSEAEVAGLRKAGTLGSS